MLRKQINGHDYIIGLHPAEEGMAISMALLAGATGLVREALTPGVELEALIDSPSFAGDVIDAIGALLRDPAMAPLLRSLFAHTSRDGIDLGKSAGFNAAYSGNYGEMYVAAVQIALGNGFLPVLDILGAIPGVAGEKKPTPTPAPKP